MQGKMLIGMLSTEGVELQSNWALPGLPNFINNVWTVEIGKYSTVAHFEFLGIESWFHEVAKGPSKFKEGPF